MTRAQSRTPAPWLDTPRLELRECVPADLPDRFRLDTDPRAARRDDA